MPDYITSWKAAAASFASAVVLYLLLTVDNSVIVYAPYRWALSLTSDLFTSYLLAFMALLAVGLAWLAFAGLLLLGVMISGTLVFNAVRARMAPKDDAPAAAPTPEVEQDPGGSMGPRGSAWDVGALGLPEVQLIRAYLQRAPALPEEARKRTGGEVAGRIARDIGADDPSDPSPFLRSVLYEWEHRKSKPPTR